MDASKEVAGGFLVAGGDTAKVLNGVEEALHQIAFGIERVVAGALHFTGDFGRDDGFDAAHLEGFDEVIGVISLVPDDRLWLDLRAERFSLGNVMGLATGKTDHKRIAEGIDNNMDFGA